MKRKQRENGGGDQAQPALSILEAGEPKTIPFAQRLTCTISEACEATGLGRTKLYELIGTGHLATTTVGRRRLVLVPSLQALLDVSSEASGMKQVW